MTIKFGHDGNDRHDGVSDRVLAPVAGMQSCVAMGDAALQNFQTVALCDSSPSSPDATYHAVLHFLDETIQFGRPTVTAAAAAAAINLRCLQRHLASCGVTFEGLLDEYRRRRAVEFLRDRDKSVTDIAFLLGYSDSAHFTRAFRRWTGGSPREFQRMFPAHQYIGGAL